MDGPFHRILHVDMDAFFASVEQLDHPELRGKPLIVGGDPQGRGVVAAASYEARAFGVHSAMSCRLARQKCPQALFVPVRPARYQEVSLKIRSFFNDVTPMVEPLSVDEAFLDVGGVLHLGRSAVELAQALRQRIRRELGLTASVGVAPNKFLAKLASDLNKPDGLTVTPLAPAEIAAFLAPLPVGRIWGVGEKSGALLERHGIHTIGDAQARSPAALIDLLGPAMGAHVHELAFGRDARTVQTESESKSLSAEHTFDQDVTDTAVLRHTLVEQCETVGRRLRRAGLWACTAHLKLRDDRFATITRQHRLAAPTHRDQTLIEAAFALLARNPPARPVRLIGFGVSRLQSHPGPTGTLDLFEPAPPAEGESRLDRAVDKLREKYGKGSIRRGG